MRNHILISLIVTAFLSACATTEPGDKRKPTPTRTAKSAPIVSVSGSARGTVILHKNRGKAALISAVGGGLTHSEVGAYMDQQANDLQGQLQAEIERGDLTIEKRPSDNALLESMSATTHFDNLSSVIKPGYLASLNKMAAVLNQYGKTVLTVIGYTDQDGPDAGNLRLSERRAQSVIDYFITQNVNPLRLQSYGKSDTDPRAENSAEAGRGRQRRVELWVQPIVAP